MKVLNLIGDQSSENAETVLQTHPKWLLYDCKNSSSTASSLWRLGSELTWLYHLSDYNPGHRFYLWCCSKDQMYK